MICWAKLWQKGSPRKVCLPFETLKLGIQFGWFQAWESQPANAALESSMLKFPLSAWLKGRQYHWRGWLNRIEFSWVIARSCFPHCILFFFVCVCVSSPFGWGFWMKPTTGMVFPTGNSVINQAWLRTLDYTQSAPDMKWTEAPITDQSILSSSSIIHQTRIIISHLQTRTIMKHMGVSQNRRPFGGIPHFEKDFTWAIRVMNSSPSAHHFRHKWNATRFATHPCPLHCNSGAFQRNSRPFQRPSWPSCRQWHLCRWSYKHDWCGCGSSS